MRTEVVYFDGYNSSWIGTKRYLTALIFVIPTTFLTLKYLYPKKKNQDLILPTLFISILPLGSAIGVQNPDFIDSSAEEQYQHNPKVRSLIYGGCVYLVVYGTVVSILFLCGFKLDKLGIVLSSNIIIGALIALLTYIIMGGF